MLLRSAGFCFRRNVRSLPGSPDFANKSRRLAVFVNGCFWHHHKGCPRATIPKRNRSFWIEKLATNRKRDARKIRQLRAMGYRVLLLWECQLEIDAGARRRFSYLRKARVVDSA
jgi:DNA mismatch endonuclease, patch repair protein